MYRGMTIVALIPARGGSVRIPGKNMIDLCGKPLLQYSIESAQRSRYVDFSMVSSDDSCTLELASSCDGCKGIVRPDNISGSDASTEQAISHAISYYLGNCDIMVVLQPTSPIRNEGRIDQAIKLLVDGDHMSVVSVTEKFALTWEHRSGRGYPNYDHMLRPSSHTHKTLVENGSIYAFNTKEYMKSETRIIHPVGLLKMTDEESVDIDTHIDLRLAGAILKEQGNEEPKSWRKACRGWVSSLFNR